ncbi:hypothetical protein [Herbiconiux sp. A18JL235]|uniref:Uncharacterized protein n=1 Tax=Herbiconiux sp. A18JL235 TaxID=3152363 RepID=A0AB39BJQ5_9MICO
MTAEAGPPKKVHRAPRTSWPRRQIVLLAVAALLLASAAAFFTATVVLIDQSKGVWASQALGVAACLFVGAANSAVWCWRLSRPPKLTVTAVARWVAVLALCSVVLVIWVVALLSNLVYPEAWSSI